MSECWPAIPTRTRVDSAGGGGVVANWSPWLTLADLDGGGVPDSDPGGILGSISEPAPGVLQFQINPDGTARNGSAEGVVWLSTVAKGWWGSQVWPTNGTGQLAVHTRFVSTTSVAGLPYMALNLFTVDGVGYGLGVGFFTSTAIDRAGPFSQQSSNATANSTIAGYTDFDGQIVPGIGSVATPALTTGLGAFGGVGMYPDGTRAHGVATNAIVTSVLPLPLQTNMLSTSTLQLGICVGNVSATAVAFTLQAQARFAVIKTPNPLI